MPTTLLATWTSGTSNSVREIPGTLIRSLVGFVARRSTRFLVAPESLNRGISGYPPRRPPTNGSAVSTLRKILSNEKLVDLPFANALGLQIARIIAARGLLHFRRAHTKTNASGGMSEHVEELRRSGITVIENFLSDDEFASVSEEFDQAQARANKDSTLVDRINTATVSMGVIPGNESDYPVTCRAFFNDPRYLSLVAANEGKSESELRRIASFKARFEMAFLYEGTGESIKSDASNSDIHSDTFYSITKAFLYLKPVAKENGAFVFVPGSHRLTASRLGFEYRHSRAADGRAPRVSDDELSSMGLEARVIECPANSLLVFNGFGFHARGRFQPGTERKSAYIEFRANAFRR